MTTDALSFTTLATTVRSVFRDSGKWLLALLAVDLLFLIAHLLLNFGYLTDRSFHLEVDGGYGELYQYLKFFICAVLLMIAGLRYQQDRATFELTFAALFVYLLVDDAFGLHEQVTELQAVYPLPALGGLPGRQWYELIFSAGIGLLLLAPIAYQLWRHRGPFLPYAALLFVGLLLLGGCGVGLDAVHSVLQHNNSSKYLESLFGLLEDFGEMLIMSGVVATVVVYWREARRGDTTATIS